jgi:hypothetical protein
LGNRGELFLDDSRLVIHIHGITTQTLGENWLVLSDAVDTVGFESKFWDSELAKWSGFMEFGRSQADFHQDPGSSDVLLSIRFMRHSADFIPAHHHELHMAWPCFMLFTQQKGNGTSRLAPEIMWVVVVVSTNCINSEDFANAWDIVLLQFSVVLFSEFLVGCLVFSGYVLKLSQVPWNIIYMIHILVPGRPLD